MVLEAKDIAPQVTWGTNPGQVIGIDQVVPNPEEMADPVTKASAEKALAYIGLEPNTDLKETLLIKCLSVLAPTPVSKICVQQQP